MTDEKKDDDVLDGEVTTEEEGHIEGDFSNLVPLTGGYITTEVIDDDLANLIRTRILAISRRVDRDRLELGALFYRARSKALYMKWTNPATGRPFQTWEEYVDKETHFHVRSIHHMVAMWWWFSALKHFSQVQELIREVGWTKARVLVGLVDDSNYEQWFQTAKELPKPDLEHVARAALDKAGVPRRQSVTLARPDEKTPLPLPPPIEEKRDDDTLKAVDDKPVTRPTGQAVNETPVNTTPVDAQPSTPVVQPDDGRKGISPPTPSDIDAYDQKRVPWTMMLDTEQREHIEQAVAAVWDVLKETRDMSKRPATSEVGRGLAIEMMATHVLSFYSGAAAQNKDLRNRLFFRDIMRGLEKNFGVDLIALDQKKGSVVYGVADEVFESIEKKLGVEIVALKRGTNEVVFGWDTAQRIDQLVSEDDGEKEDAEPPPGGPSGEVDIGSDDEDADDDGLAEVHDEGEET